jgi:PleD family two-component response regulator
LIGRYGGEEFSIILPRADCETACQIADRLRLSIAIDPSAQRRETSPSPSALEFPA